MGDICVDGGLLLHYVYIYVAILYFFILLVSLDLVQGTFSGKLWDPAILN